MPPVVAAVVSIAASVAASFVASAVVKALIVIAASLAVTLLSKKPKNTNKLNQGAELRTKIDPTMNRQVLAGFVGTGGSCHFTYTTTNDSKKPNRYLYRVIQISDQPINNLVRVVVGKEVLTFAGDITTGWRECYQYRAKNGAACCWMRVHKGSFSPTADSTLISETYGVWSASHKGTGIAYAIIKLDNDVDAFPNGEPEFTYHVEGALCYDDRKDSTVPGGSGPQRRYNYSTWAYTDTASVITAQYLRGFTTNYIRIVGVGADERDLSTSMLFSAHNTCESTVEINEGTEKRYVAGMIMNANERASDVLEDLQAAMDGKIFDRGGAITILPGANRTPVMNLNDQDIVWTAEKSWQPKASLEAMLNCVTGNFIDSGNFFLEADLPILKNSLWEEDDGSERFSSFYSFRAVNRRTQGQRITKRLHESSRYTGTCAFVGSIWLLEMEQGDWFTLSSQRWGFSSKYFEIQDITLTRDMRVALVGREVHPNSDLWDHSVDEVPRSDTTWNPPAYDLPLPDIFINPYSTNDPITGLQAFNIEVGLTDPTRYGGFVKRVEVEFIAPGELTSTSAGWFTVDQKKTAITGLAPGTGYQVRARLSDGTRSGSWTTWSNADTAPATNITAGQVVYTDPEGGPTTVPVQELMPAEPGATEGAPTGTNVAGVPSQVLVSTVNTAVVNIADLTVAISDLEEVYGDTVSAAASAAAAAASASAADTHRANAELAKNASQTAATASAAARDLAQTAQSNAETAAGAASGSATAAAGSASVATSKASEAAGSASAAAASATVATTKASEASTSASAAATSASDSSGSAASAASSASTSATARDAARLAAKTTYPDNFTDPSNWANFGTWGGSSAFPGTNAFTYGGGSINSQFLIPIVDGETYRFTMRHRVVNQGGGYTYLGVGMRNDALAVVYSAAWSNIAHQPSGALNQWQVSIGEMTAASLLALAPTASWMYIVALIGYDTVSDGEISSIKYTNITSEKAAGGYATAASTSAASAAASATTAGEQASAAATSATSASTSAGNAGTSATQAATSASNASGSASAAASSATVAASARDAAFMGAVTTIPSDFQQGGRFFGYPSGNPATMPGLEEIYAPYISFPVDSALGKICRNDNYTDYFHVFVKQPLALIVGRRYRIMSTVRMIAPPASGSTLLTCAWYANSADYSTIYYDGYGVPQPVSGYPASGYITVGSGLVTIAQDLDVTGTITHPWVRAGIYTWNGSLAQGVIDVVNLIVKDVTSEYAAKLSADASATSASTASAHKDAAASSASAASSSATAAATSATNAAASSASANTFATNSSNSATSAAGSAAAAASSASVAASAASSAVGITGNFDFASGLAGWGDYNAVPITSANYTINDGAFGWASVLITNASTQEMRLVNFKKVPIVSGRKYKFSARFGYYNTGATGTSSTSYLGVRGYSANNSWVNDYWLLLSGTASLDGQTSTPSATFDGADILAVMTSSVQMALQVALNNNNAANLSYLDHYTLEDVTESVVSGGFASAAATSASNASASATSAGLSATSATASANTATVQAGNALASANSASTSATAASNSAAAALASQILTASVSLGAINPNPIFANWPVGQTYPTGAADVGVSGITRITGENSQGNAMRCTGDAANYSYIGFNVGSSLAPSLVDSGYYIAAADVRLNSGTFESAGILLQFYNSSNVYMGGSWDINIPFTKESMDGGATLIQGGTTGLMYRIRKLVRVPSGAVSFYIYACNHFASMGSMASANVIDWHRLALSSASRAEIDGAQAISEVRVLAGAVADIQGRQSAFWQTQAAVAGSGATAFLTVRADSSDPSNAPVTAVTVVGSSFVGRRAKRIANATSDWHNGFNSVEAYTNTAYLQASCPVNNAYSMIGLTEYSETQAPYYPSIHYAIYFNNVSGMTVYESGSDPIGHVPYTPTDYFSVEYNQDAGGTIIYKKNGKDIIRTVTGVGTGKTYRLMCSMYSFTSGSVSEISNIVFGPTPPSATSSVAIGAQEIVLVNTMGSVTKIALRLANGDAAFAGNIYAGGKIIMGNGNTGWEVAVKPKIFVVKDGDAVTWANLGYIPTPSFNPVGLAVLASGESYNLYLDTPSATGGTARLKINVPGTPSAQVVTGGTSGGSGNPTLVISKGGAPDATGGLYVYNGSVQDYAQGYNEGSDIFSTHNVLVSFWAKVGGTWTKIGEESLYDYVYQGTEDLGYYYHTMYFDSTATAPSGVTDFGITSQSYSGTVNYMNFVQVSWTSPGSASGVRTASPNNETCQLTVTA